MYSRQAKGYLEARLSDNINRLAGQDGGRRAEE